MELTKAHLQQLPSAETMAREQRLTAQYVAAIRGHVLQVARDSTTTTASFWIVDPVVAHLYLKGSSHLLYPWHPKYIGRFKSPLASGHLRRPIPVAGDSGGSGGRLSRLREANCPESAPD